MQLLICLCVYGKKIQDMPGIRIKSVDALRGLALGAILLANLPYDGAIAQKGEADKMLETLFHVLIDKKFITIFSILFGFGFYQQMQSAERRSVNFRKYFLIRMILLFVIGSINGYLLWFGDIIRAYALGGIILLYLYKIPLKQMVYLAVSLNIVLTGIIFIGNGALGWQEYSYDYSLAGKLPVATSYLEYLRINFIINPWTNFRQDIPLTLAFTFGSMLIGFVMAKVNFFAQPNKKLLDTFLVAGVFFGIPASYVFTFVLNGTLELTPALLWLPFVLVLGMVLQSLGYISIFVKLYDTKIFNRLLSAFIPVGQTALTNYLLQSVFYILVFYHCTGAFQLYGKLSLAETYLTGIVLYALQTVISTLWLRFFRQGPVEYAWKRVAYQYFQPPQKQ